MGAGFTDSETKSAIKRALKLPLIHSIALQIFIEGLLSKAAETLI